MTEPQVWTLIGVFAAALFGLLTIMSTMFVRVLRAELGGVNTRIDGVHARIDGLQAEIAARFEGVDRRIDHLDRDVQMLVRHTFPDP